MQHIDVLSNHEYVVAVSDMETLCQDRPLESVEIFTPNSFYGADGVLKAYAGLPPERPIHAVIPHGIYFDPTFIWRYEANVPVPAVLSYPQFRDDAYRAGTNKLVIPAAAPYVYAAALMKAPAAERKGTLYFPKKSTHHLISKDNAQIIAPILADLPAEWQPITVCVYWKDFLMGRHQVFLDHGLRVVSAGHIYDPLFLLRLHYLCLQHAYSAGDAIGSHVFYSVHSGCTYVHFDRMAPPPAFGLEGVPCPETNAFQVPRPPSTDLAPDVRDVFLRSDPLPWSTQKEAADYFLGADRMLSPRQLRDLVGDLRKLDRNGVAFVAGQRVVDLPPTSWRRFFGRSKGFVAARRRAITSKWSGGLEC